MASIAQVTVRFGADLKDFSTKMQRANKEVLALGRTMQSTGRNLSTKITLPILALAGASTKLAVDFDESMTKIQTLVGVSADVVSGFRSEVLELAGKTSQAPAVLADALFTVTSAGIRGAESMRILEMAAKGSASGMGETKEIARAVTAVMQAYGVENISAAKAMDILTATVREGNLEAGQLAPVLGRVIGLSAQLGIGFDEIGASIATFTRLGVDSAEAVTGLKGLLGGLISPSAQGADALASVGTSFAGLRKEIDENGLATTLIKLINTFEGNEEALSTVIPNVRALAAVLGTASAQGNQYLTIQDNITKSTGLANKVFEETAKSGAFKIKNALNEISKVGTEIGIIVLPVVVKLAESVKALFERFSNLSPATQEMIVKTALFAATVGPLIMGVGALITGFGKLLGTLRILGVFIAANPWFALAAGVAAVVVAIGTYNKVSAVFKEANKVQATGIERQRTELNFLVTELIDVNDQEDKRSKLIKEISSKYPEFLKGLDQEKVTIGELKNRLADFNKEFEKKIKLQAAEEQAVELTKNLANAEAELARLKTSEGLNEALGAIFGTDDFETFRKDASDALMEQIKAYESGPEGVIPLAEGSIARIRKALTELRASYDLIGDLFGDGSDGKKVDPNDKFVLEKNQAPVFDTAPLISEALPALQTMSDSVGNVTIRTKELQRAWANWNNELHNTPTILEEGVMQVFTGIGDIIGGVFDDLLEGSQVTFGGIVKSIGGLIVKLVIAAAAAAALRAILGDPGAATDGVGAAKGIGSALAGLAGSFGGFRAMGGSVDAGKTYMVGESGPELLQMGGSGFVTPNHMLGGGGASPVRLQGEFRLKNRELVLAIDQEHRLQKRT